MVGIQWNEFVGNNWRNVGLILKLKSNPVKIIFWKVQFMGYQPIDFQILRSTRPKERKHKNSQRTRRLDGWDGNGLQRKVGDRSSGARKNVAPPQPHRLRFGRHRENPACPALRRASLLMSKREERDDGESKQQAVGTLIAGKKKFSSCDKVLWMLNRVRSFAAGLVCNDRGASYGKHTSTHEPDNSECSFSPSYQHYSGMYFRLHPLIRKKLCFLFTNYT